MTLLRANGQDMKFLPAKIQSTVDGKTITIYKEPDASKLPWGKLDVDVVLECTGFYTKKDKAMAHINAGAKKVVISAPAGNDVPTIVYSVNEKTLKPEDKIISAASCTTNCLAPMVDTLEQVCTDRSWNMCTVHAYTGDQMILDGPQKRRSAPCKSRCHQHYTGFLRAAKAIGLVIPELNGKLIGAAQRVPVPTGSTTLLFAVVKGKDVTVDGINAAMKSCRKRFLCIQHRSDRFQRCHRRDSRFNLRFHTDHGLQDR